MRPSVLFDGFRTSVAPFAALHGPVLEATVAVFPFGLSPRARPTLAVTVSATLAVAARRNSAAAP